MAKLLLVASGASALLVGGAPRALSTRSLAPTMQIGPLEMEGQWNFRHGHGHNSWPLHTYTGGTGGTAQMVVDANGVQWPPGVAPTPLSAAPAQPQPQSARAMKGVVEPVAQPQYRSAVMEPDKHEFRQGVGGQALATQPAIDGSKAMRPWGAE